MRNLNLIIIMPTDDLHVLDHKQVQALRQLIMHAPPDGMLNPCRPSPAGNSCAFISSWTSDAIWRRRSGSTLAQVMAWCLTAPSHYLNQCWLIIKGVRWRSPESNSTSAHEIQLYVFEDYTFEIATTSPKGQWVNPPHADHRRAGIVFRKDNSIPEYIYLYIYIYVSIYIYLYLYIYRSRYRYI